MWQRGWTAKFSYPRAAGEESLSIEEGFCTSSARLVHDTFQYSESCVGTSVGSQDGFGRLTSTCSSCIEEAYRKHLPDAQQKLVEV